MMDTLPTAAARPAAARTFCTLAAAPAMPSPGRAFGTLGNSPAGWRAALLALLLALTLPAAQGTPTATAKRASPPRAKPPVQSDHEPDRVTYGRRDDVMRFAAEAAQAHGLDQAAAEAALAKARYLPAVARLIMPPPAGTAKSWAAYRARFVEPARIQAGIAFREANKRTLAAAEQHFGVPAEVILGILGVETYYGRLTGNFRVLDALATLAFDFPPGRRDRSAFFRDELAQFLKLCQREGVAPESIKGSYAGAIGLGQFMPGSILRHAIDGDGDGHVDMAGNPADVIASVAHYLRRHGWQPGQPTHFAVQPPAEGARRATLLAPDILPSFTARQLADQGAQLDAAGQAHGGLLALVELQNGEAAPSHVAGGANFYAVTRYNQSSYYALAVIELGRAIGGLGTPAEVAALAAAAPPPTLAALAKQPATGPREDLRGLFDNSWQRGLREDPLAATYWGDHRFDAGWPDLRRSALDAVQAALRADLAAAETIAIGTLDATERRHLALFRLDRERRLAAAAFRPEQLSLRPGGGVQALHEVAELMPFETPANYDTWLARLRTLPAYLDQTIAVLTEGLAAGRTPPKLLVERVLPQLAQQLVERPEDSPFHARFTRYPDSVPAAERQRLAEAARQVIAEQVVPAYRRLDSFLRQTYLPGCRESVGLAALPDGAAHYAERIRFHTGSTLGAAQIHDSGVAEVAQIRTQMHQLMRETGFTGELPQFFDFLRSDPRFFHKTPEDLLAAYTAAARRIEPELPKLFGRLYRTPFEVRAIPALTAPGTTTAYYAGPSDDGRRPGTYYVNLYRPEVRPTWEIEVLTAHESVPGHHLQIALAQEQAGLPAFLRFADQTAFVEGWALYAERLGYALGLYRDPYARFGQLTYDMWRALRLVIDTGLHTQGWTRQQAIDYFKANAPKTEVDIVNEVDRYIADPGQALAYKLGQRQILALRGAAEQALGERFDLRAFHDALLANGALPMEVLDADMRQWIAAQQAAPAVAATGSAASAAAAAAAPAAGAGVADATQPACPDSPGFRRLAAHDRLYLGEVHGSTEVPALVECLVRAALQRDGPPLLVSLEMPPEAADPASPAWRSADGRASQAMARLHAFLRTQQAAGRLRVHYHVIDLAGTSQADYERRVAAGLAEAARGHRLIVLAGNLHSRREPIPELPELVPNGALLGPLLEAPMVHVDVRWLETSASWSCRGEPMVCGEHALPALPPQLLAGARAGDLVDGKPFGHDLAYYLPRLTASPPARGQGTP